MGRLFFPLWVVQIQSNHICWGRMFFRIQSNLTLDELRRKTNSEPGQSTSEIISYTYLCYIFIGRISSPQETCLQSSPKEIFLQSLQKKTYLQSLELCEAFKEVAHRQNNSRKANLGASQSRSKQFSKDTIVLPWFPWNSCWRILREFLILFYELHHSETFPQSQSWMHGESSKAVFNVHIVYVPATLIKHNQILVVLGRF